MDLNPEVGWVDLGIRRYGESRSKSSKSRSRRQVDLDLIWWIYDIISGAGTWQLGWASTTRYTQDRRLSKAWPGDPSLLKTQVPAIGSGKHKNGRHTKARDTLQGNPGPYPDPEYWIHGPPDPSRKPTGSGHYTAKDVQVKIEQEDQASSELGSMSTRLNEVRSTDRQSARRTSVGGTEADPDPDLEAKPQLPPQVPSGTSVDLDPRQDPPTKQTKAGRERYGFADSMAKPEHYISPSRKSARGGGIQAKQASTRVKMKAPDPEGEDPIQVAPSWSYVDLEYAFHQEELRGFLALGPVMLELKQLGDLQGPLAPPQMATGKLDAVKSLMSLPKEAGLVAGRFDANDLFDLDLDQIQSSTQGLFDKLKALVGGTQLWWSGISQILLRPDPVTTSAQTPTNGGVPR
ncbi:unnamed protein product [Phytophthora fragariaefolia]|uniref:Unnamed protein product n=1 Tax=Phytophthora fragariaefolia TaxID=1490495 RepID=A0A9W7CVK7_9STRA|nr:unnamed protein product [Phytophthora fragariaefolia]